jgi:hypothetical protein
MEVKGKNTLIMKERNISDQTTRKKNIERIS